MRKKLHDGFTLTETIITVSIIAILALIILPNLLTIREKTNAGSCTANMKHIEGAMEQCAFDYQKTPGDTVTWKLIVPTYIRQVPICPGGGLYRTYGSSYDLFILGDTVVCSIGQNNPLIEWDDHIYR